MEKIINATVEMGFPAQTKQTGLTDVKNKITKVNSALGKTKKILKYSVFTQAFFALFIVLNVLSSFGGFGSHWLSEAQLEVVPIVLDERPVRTIRIDASSVSCAMWRICDTNKHYQHYDKDGKTKEGYSGPTQYSSFTYSKDVQDLNKFLRNNPNFRSFFAAQGVSNRNEAVDNFYSINKYEGQKVPELQVKQLQQKLQLGDYAPPPSKPIKKYLFSLICLIGVFQAYMVIKGRKEVQYTKRLQNVVNNSLDSN